MAGLVRGVDAGQKEEKGKKRVCDGPSTSEKDGVPGSLKLRNVGVFTFAGNEPLPSNRPAALVPPRFQCWHHPGCITSILGFIADLETAFPTFGSGFVLGFRGRRRTNDGEKKTRKLYVLTVRDNLEVLR